MNTFTCRCCGFETHLKDESEVPEICLECYDGYEYEEEVFDDEDY